MPYRPVPTRDECIEALQVMIEGFGFHATKEMLEEALKKLKEEGA